VTIASGNQTGKDFTSTQVTYTLSGTVSGDIASGVTITLTGDASDSTTTAGDGTYSFTLPNGDYTVTPSLANYSFSPTSTNVTIASGNQTGKDFTSAELTYTLSGTVSGYSVSGVTITLTGDASDSTTTAGDGTYSFTLPDGSYTVTPTKTGSTFSPTSTNVTISGGNQTGKNFTATDANAIPETFLSWGSGETHPVDDAAWNKNAIYAGTVQKIANEAVATVYSYTPAAIVPSGVQMRWNSNGVEAVLPGFGYTGWSNAGKYFDIANGFRVQLMFGVDATSERNYAQIMAYTSNGAQVAPVDYIIAGAQVTKPTCTAIILEYIGGARQDSNNWTNIPDGGHDTPHGGQWATIGMEFPAGGTGTIKVRTQVFAPDTASYASGPSENSFTLAADWSSKTLDAAAMAVYWRGSSWQGNCKANYFWVGALTDDWPA
jgi:hypothetical protein